MNMIDIIIVAVILGLVGMAIAHIRKEKKKGVRCIGCPAAGVCSRKCKNNTGSGRFFRKLGKAKQI